MRKLIGKLLIFAVVSTIIIGVMGTASLVYFSFSLPKISKLSDYRPPLPSKILAKDGTVLADIHLQKRELVLYEDIPTIIVDAFLSAEDSNFFNHSGVDYISVFRAFLANLKAGRVVQGGSTITQQVAKSLLLTRERSVTRKIKDFLLAQKIEEKFSKKEILFLYLNQVYLGGGYYGVKAAFEGYFEKSLEEATIAESAMIAGLLVAPGKYSPYINPQRAKSRQTYVLGRLFANGKISEEAYKEALAEKIRFNIRRGSHFKAGYFTDWVRQRVVAIVGEDAFKVGGYTVQTTLDWEMQQVAEKEVLEGVKAIDKRQGYKGPIANIEKDKWDEVDRVFREKIYLAKSNFFKITDDYKRDYELTLDESFQEQIKEDETKFREIVKKKTLFPGNNKEDKLLEHLEIGKNYFGIVKAIDNIERLVYISVGGLVGIIPYEGFRWAHERKITEDRHYYSYVTRPSSVFKIGDKVNVLLKSKSARLFKIIFNKKDSSLHRLGKKAKSALKRERYLLLELDQNPDAQGALVSVDVNNGEIRAFVGGSDFSQSQFNRAIQSLRQPGSAFKPLLFASALENGFHPASIIIDSPETLGGVDESLNWKPRNYDGKFKGPMTFRNSLEVSRNVPTIKIASEVGVPKIIKFLERIGFKAKMEPDLSISLGSFGVTLLDLVSTYALFPAGGKMLTPKSIVSVTDRDGNYIPFSTTTGEDEKDSEQINENTSEAETKGSINGEEKQDLAQANEEKNQFLENLSGDYVYDSRLAYIMSNILRGVILHGTGRSARSVSTFLGGKTGTTSNYVDAWFVGFSSNTATGVWTGFDENNTLGWGETGTKSALPIWKGFMKANLKKYGENDFRVPTGIVNALINKETGKLIGDGAQNGFMEAFVEGTGPLASGDNAELSEDDSKKLINSEVFEEDDFYSQ